MLSYLALGDSYTIGEAVPIEERWPNQLSAALRRRGLEVSDPVIIAKTGWTTDELEAAIKCASLADHYDLVSLSIGVNNQYRGRTVGEYRVQFRALLEWAASMSEHKVIVVSIPDWSVTPFAKNRDRAVVSREINVFNLAALESCRDLGVRFVDITELSRSAADDDSLTAPDGLHPSGKMYSSWLPKLEDAATAVLTVKPSK